MLNLSGERQKPIPVTMLSGFLGAGKTTLLRYLLEQNVEKIGCIVNDVASINIDAKLLRNDRTKGKSATNTTSDLADTVELANGCACCSIQDELFSSFEQLLALADQRGIKYDRFVLENSGVAEPQNLRDKFAEAVLEGHPVMSRICMDAMVTVVDSGTFIKDYSSRAPLAARPDLGEGGTLRPVVDLLVEQIECADFILLNKKDQLAEGELKDLIDIAHQLNPLAKVEACEHGIVDVQQVFGPNSKGVIAHMNTEGQHRGAVAAAKAAAEKAKHSHAHSHDHEEEGHHDNGHSHSHSHEGKHDDDDDDDDDDKHKHHHHHHHDHEHADEAAHGHSHEEHSHDHAHHKHEHKQERQETTAAARFGIKSFVYTRRRPFHPQRLRDMVLKWLPVAQNTAIGEESPAPGDSPIKAVLRSKGFMWLSYSHTTAFYWSHAGQHFEIRDEGDWWACVTDEDWPSEPAQRSVIVSDFDLSTELGDRRQEIVFIGAGMDEAAISQRLDTALLDDDEMEKYKARFAEEADPPHPDIKMLQERSKKQKV